MYIKNRQATVISLKKLNDEYEKVKPLSDEEFAQLRDKYINNGKINWIKHIYNCNGNAVENDSRYDFLNITNPVVLPVIIDRLLKTK